MEKHKKIVEKYEGTLSGLAEDIGNLHYETLTEFLTELSNKLRQDSNKDADAGRVKLAEELFMASAYVKEASEKIGRAWVISKPFMK